MGPQNHPKAKNTYARIPASSVHLMPVMFRYKSKACHGRFSVLVFIFEDTNLRNVKPFSLLNTISKVIKIIISSYVCVCECVRCSNVWMLNICSGCSVCSSSERYSIHSLGVFLTVVRCNLKIIDNWHTVFDSVITWKSEIVWWSKTTLNIDIGYGARVIAISKIHLYENEEDIWNSRESSH